jgi:hypothetical protein
MGNEPIFVLGAGRSGTTLMRFALDTHPRIAVPCEWNFTVPLVRAYAHFVERATELGAGAADRPFTEIGIDRSCAEVRATFRAQLEGWYLEYAARRGKVRWGATTHRLLDQSVDVLDDLLDGDAVYIVLVRHPLDHATSAIERFNHAEFHLENVERMLRYWVNTVTHHLQVERQLPDRCTRVRYEDLVAEPEARLRAVFEFIGESHVPDIHEEMFAQPHDGDCGDHKIRRTSSVQRTSVGRWKGKLEPAVVDAALRASPAAQRLMDELGYTV